MKPSPLLRFYASCVLCGLIPVTTALAQNVPYDNPPPVTPPYHRVRYEAPPDPAPGQLIFPVQYTLWIPPDIDTLRGLIVHQHGCGEGSCKSGQTGAFDLHWQALARKHDCALLAPSYEQPQEADCQMWCDPRNGSDAAFQQALADLGELCVHPELATVPWALWGHSGGGHWAGGMTLLHPERVAAAWLRSGVPLFEADPERPGIAAHDLPEAALRVPIMCNPGTREGVTAGEGKFAGVWPSNKTFFDTLRGKGGLIGVAVDPLTAHECGNQRYLAIPWLDTCLSARLPKTSGSPLSPMPDGDSWLAPLLGAKAVPASEFEGDPHTALWLPDKTIAEAWMHYVEDTGIPDTTPPPAPTNIEVKNNEITWSAQADLESGIARFIIERDGIEIATVPEDPSTTNRFGRPLFQGLQYSDTPAAPLVEMRFSDTTADPAARPTYRVIAVNTAGLGSDGFASLFNGKDLTGWEGDPRLWKVEDGIVVGTCNGPGDFEHNTFLIWRGGTVADFELRAAVRILGDNNSGIQYRSRAIPGIGPWAITGYQCDIHPAVEHTGMTYEEKGRGIFGLNGKNVLLDREGASWLLSEHEPVAADLSRWNEFTIIARGNHLVHKVNGKITSTLIDHHEEGRALEGLLAIQLHSGNPHRVEVKDLRIKVLDDGEILPFDLPAGATPIEKPRTTRPQGTGPAAPRGKK